MRLSRQCFQVAGKGAGPEASGLGGQVEAHGLRCCRNVPGIDHDTQRQQLKAVLQSIERGADDDTLAGDEDTATTS